MRLNIIKEFNASFDFMLSIYLPYICVGKKDKIEVGTQYSNSMITLPTCIKIQTATKILKWTFRLLGFGFSIYFKEKE